MTMIEFLLLVLAALLTLLAVAYLVPAAHQTAHVIAARRAGLRVVDIRNMPVQLHRTRRGMRVRLMSGFQGAGWGILVDPFSIEDERLTPALARFARAGTVGLSAYVVLGFGLIGLGRVSDIVLWAGVALVVATVLAAAQSVTRPKSGLVRTDGWVAQTLGREDGAAVSLVDAARINYFTDFARARPRDYPQTLATHAAHRWASRDRHPGQPDESLACGRVVTLIHLDRGEWSEAAAVLEAMVAVGSPTPGDGRHHDWVHLHRVIVHALGRGDATAAVAAFGVVKSIAGAKHLSLHTGARSAIALAAGMRSEAAALASQALDQTAFDDPPGQIAMQRELWQHVAHTAAYGATLPAMAG